MTDDAATPVRDVTVEADRAEGVVRVEFVAPDLDEEVVGEHELRPDEAEIEAYVDCLEAAMRTADALPDELVTPGATDILAYAVQEVRKAGKTLREEGWT
jgi:hypothetical protein